MLNTTGAVVSDSSGLVGRMVAVCDVYCEKRLTVTIEGRLRRRT
jgi:hypothetical protein